MFGSSPQEKAYFAPFALFLAFLMLNEAVGKVGDNAANTWWLAEPQFWVFPLQTAVCGALMLRWRRFYSFQWKSGLVFGTFIGVAVFAIWIAPQAWLGAAPRLDGFDPTYFGRSGPAFDLTVVLRFLRLAVVVPFLEEIFWRGYLLRLFIGQPFNTVPIGTFSWLSFTLVTAGFCLEHQPIDWPAAVLAGILYNVVAYRTKSLGACVLAHAITNLLLGFFVMRTGQWGFW